MWSLVYCRCSKVCCKQSNVCIVLCTITKDGWKLRRRRIWEAYTWICSTARTFEVQSDWRITLAIMTSSMSFWYVVIQGVVTYTLPAEAFVTGIKNLDWWKLSLIAWSLRSEALDRLILREFKGQNVATPPKYLRKCVDRLIFVAQNSSWSLDRLLKEDWSLDSILIPVANTSTGNVYVTNPYYRARLPPVHQPVARTELCTITQAVWATATEPEQFKF